MDEEGYSTEELENSVKKEDTITPEVSYNDDGVPIITIVVTGKVIDYTGNDNAKNIAERINNFADHIWIGEEGFFQNWVSQSRVNVTDLNFTDEEGKKLTGEVIVDFRFEAADSITEASADDHVIALVPTFSTTDRSNLFYEGTVIPGVTTMDGGKVVFMDYYTFTGLKDWSHGYGEAIAGHEIVTHTMGLSHTTDEKGKVTYGKGVYSFSDKVTTKEAYRILENINQSKLNRGDNSIRIRQLGVRERPLIPNISTKDPRLRSVRAVGVDINTIIRYESNIQNR